MDLPTCHLKDKSQRPKRQRRSYSCGQCKSLKIKCDLHIPCSSCVKFKRVKKCLLDPPHPPSEDELNKIHQRKSRSQKRKQQIEDQHFSSVHPSPTSAPPGPVFQQMGPFVQDQQYPYYPPQHIPQMPQNDRMPPMPLQQAAFRPPEPIKDEVASFQMQRSIAPPVQLPVHMPANFIQFPGSYYTPQETQFHSPESRSPEFSSSSSSTVSYAPKLDLRPTIQTPVIPRLNLRKSHSTESIHHTRTLQEDHESDKHKFVDLDPRLARDILSLIPYSPNVTTRLFELYFYLQYSNQDALIDIETVYTKFITFQNLLQNQPETSVVDVHTLKNVSLAFFILASGLILFNEPANRVLNPLLAPSKTKMAKKWIELSKQLKEKVSTLSKLGDFVFLVDWFFIARTYYHHHSFNAESYTEFNNLLSAVSLSEHVMELIREKDDNFYENPESVSPTYREQVVIAWKMWFHIAMLELRTPFYQMKGTMFTAASFKDTVVPHRKAIRVVFGPKILSGEETHVLSCGMRIAALYFRRFDDVKSLKFVIKSYLMLYKETFDIIDERVVQFQNKLNNSNYTISDGDLDIVIQIQTVLNLYIRWMSFVKFEANYFASLRFASFLTTMVVIFNCFNFVDDILIHQSSGKVNLSQLVIRNYSAMYLTQYYECLIFQGLFLVILDNFRDGDGELHQIDLGFVFSKVFQSFRIALAKLNNYGGQVKMNKSEKKFDGEDSDYEEDVNTSFNPDYVPLNKIKIFEQTIRVGYKIRSILESGRSTKEEKFHTFIAYFEEQLDEDEWSFLIEFNFGTVENFKSYVSKIWELMRFLKSTTMANNIVISKSLNFNMDLISRYNNKMTGLKLDEQMIDEYITEVVEPNIIE